MEEENWGNYYLAIEENNETILYKSSKFALDEIDVINIIKICLVQKRAVSVGKKFLYVYTDSQQHNKEKINKILKNIGVDYQNDEPTKSKRTKKR
jgi:hypothetical protein